jgi:hypothetical protein
MIENFESAHDMVSVHKNNSNHLVVTLPTATVAERLRNGK